MARIVSVSYDEALLFTRELLLRERNHTVNSGLGYIQAMEQCSAGGADLLVLGHSIPKSDKLKIIECFREANPNALVIALIRANESRLSQVDAYVYPGNPEDLVRAIDYVAIPATTRSKIRRVK